MKTKHPTLNYRRDFYDDVNYQPVRRHVHVGRCPYCGEQVDLQSHHYDLCLFEQRRRQTWVWVAIIAIVLLISLWVKTR